MKNITIPRIFKTERLILRRWETGDAAMLLPVLEANRDHLKEWIPEKVSSPVPLPELEKRLAGFAKDFNKNVQWRFAVFSHDEKTLLGEAPLFPASGTGRVPFKLADRVEIGYWLRADATGKGYAAEATLALIELSTSVLKMKRIEIHCDAKNTASLKVPQKLGFNLAEPEKDADPGMMVWVLNKV